MKTFSIVVISFILGAAFSGYLGYKMFVGLVYQAAIGKLADNTIFYEQIESGQAELTQHTIASSLDWFIAMAEEGSESIWVESNEVDKQILARAKKLQKKLNRLKESR